MERLKTGHIPHDELSPIESNPNFRGTDTITVFLAEGYETQTDHGVDIVKGLHYVISANLLDYAPEVKEIAFKKAEEQVGNTDTAQYFEEFLRIVYKQPNILLIHITSGFDLNSKQPYNYFGYLLPSDVKPRFD